MPHDLFSVNFVFLHPHLRLSHIYLGAPWYASPPCSHTLFSFIFTLVYFDAHIQFTFTLTPQFDQDAFPFSFHFGEHAAPRGAMSFGEALSCTAYAARGGVLGSNAAARRLGY